MKKFYTSSIFLFLFGLAAFAQQNIALNMQVTTSTVGNSGYPKQLNDGNYNTAWNSTTASTNQWIQIDLGNVYDLNKIVLSWGNLSAAVYSISGSGNGADWTTIAQKTNNQTSNTQSLDLSDVNTIRYVRIDMTAPLTSGYAINEVEVYGTLSNVVAVSALTLTPKNELLITGYTNPHILSLNNSLIDYNDQPTIFNPLAVSAGKNAIWEKQTRLGQSLRYHYEEGDGLLSDGTPTAKYRIRSQAWTHIILQELSDKPLTDYADFLASVKLWVAYIRANCPNPSARIILDMNWPYTDAVDFEGDMTRLWNNYMMVAAETGVSVFPVGKAYDLILNEDGVTVKNSLYSDNRHPTVMASYLSACTILGSLYELNPVGIAYYPASMTQNQATLMQTRAHEASLLQKNTCDISGTIHFTANLNDQFNRTITSSEPINWSVSGGGTIDNNGNFSSNGTAGVYTATATCGLNSSTVNFEVKNFVIPATLASITLKPGTSVVTLGQTMQFTATGYDLTGSVYTFQNPTSWTVSGTGATIDSNGLFTATQKGFYTITATNNGLSKTATIEVLPANANLSIGSTATASTGTASLAIDNNSGTRWESSFSDPQWVSVDLGSLKNVSDIIIRWETASAKDYTVDYSLDNVSWTTALSQLNQLAGANRVDRMYDLNFSARYVRISGTARTTAYGYSIYELQIYGTAQSGNTPDLSFETSTPVTKNYGDPSFQNVARSSNSTGTITYGSSNTSVATVNSNTGVVTIISSGTAVISATIASSGIYGAGTANYTLYVNGPSTVSTQAVTGITTNAATANGTIVSLGYPFPTQYGHCWSTASGPTILNSKTTNGAISSIGTFTSSLTGLTESTTYHVRAYATNSSGTVYGAEVTFTTQSSNVINAGTTQVIQGTSGVYTWTCPSGVTSIQVECWGGGGAGGGTVATTSPTANAGGGGAGGSYVKHTSVTVVPGTVYSYTVGAGGTGVSVGNGNSGGNTTFNSTTIIAYGGGGGSVGTITTSAGGTCQTPTTGTVNYAGGSGGAGKGSTGYYSGGGGGGADSGGAGHDASNSTITGGAAGSSGGGAGGAGISATGAIGNAGSAAGGGGAGSTTGQGNVARAGGAGAPGKIILTYTLPGTPTLSFATPTSVTKNYGDAAFSNVATSSNSQGAITYSSSNTSVATVNSSTGLVTILSTGSAVITATIAAYGDYVSGSTSYTLTVNQNGAKYTGLTSVASDGTSPTSIFDGNYTTRWQDGSNLDAAWITVNLGSVKNVNSIKIYWEAANARAYNIQVSTDNSNWTTIATKTGMAAGNRTDIISGLNSDCQYIRMQGVTRQLAYGYSIFEFEVYPAMTPMLTTLTVSPSTSSIVPGANKQLTAGGLDQIGNAFTLTGTTTWSVSGSGASIDSNGLFSSTQKGLFTVTATNSGISQTATVDVLPSNTDLSYVSGVSATATASSGTASLAFDNNSGSRWESAASDPQWIMVDLGSVKYVTDIIINWETASAKDFSIDFSNDNITWTSALTKTGMSAGINRTDRIYDINAQTRYVRMTGIARTTVYGYSVYEFHIYGADNPTTENFSTESEQLNFVIAQGLLRIYDTNIKSITVYNVSGLKVFSGQSAVAVDLWNLVSGVYIVRALTTDNKIKQIKIMK